MIVRFTRRAEADLVAIQDYLERRSPEGARRVAASLLQTIEVVANHPQSGASTRRPHVFVKIVPNYPYKIFYRVSERSIDILHVRHSARRPWIV
jgi:plasmid stabilization system protein ParE